MTASAADLVPRAMGSPFGDAAKRLKIDPSDAVASQSSASAPLVGQPGPTDPQTVAVVGATKFVAFSTDHHDTAKSLASRYENVWPRSSGFRAVVAKAEKAAAKVCKDGMLQVQVSPDFAKALTALDGNGTTIKVPMGRDVSTDEEIAAGGLTGEEIALLFELQNAASRGEFEKLNRQARSKDFEGKTLADLPPALRAKVQKPSDIPEMVFAIETERLEHANTQRCWRVIQELGPAAQNSVASRKMKRLAEADFGTFLRMQAGAKKVHFDGIRSRYRSMCPHTGASAA